MSVSDFDSITESRRDTPRRARTHARVEGKPGVGKMSVQVAPPSANRDGGAMQDTDLYKALKRELEEFLELGPQVRRRTK